MERILSMTLRMIFKQRNILIASTLVFGLVACGKNNQVLVQEQNNSTSEVTCQANGDPSQIVRVKIDSENHAEVLALSNEKNMNTHFTGWEMKNYITSHFGECLKSKIHNLSFKKYSDTPDKKHSTLLSRSLDGVSGFYVKILEPHFAKFLVPNGKSQKINCDALTEKSLEKFGCTGDCKIKTLETCSHKTCENLNFVSKNGLYEEVSHGVFIETHSDNLDQPLFNLNTWEALYPGFNVYVNTSWFNVTDFGPYETPCSSTYGITVSQGTKISGAISNTQESLALLAILKNHEVMMISPEAKDQYMNQIENAFSGMLVMKNGIEIYPMPNISIPGSTTGRTAFAIDSENNLIVLVANDGFNVSKIISFMKENLDAKDILIADGGGSSNMILNDPNSKQTITTKHRDVQGYRPVPGILAFSADQVVVDKSILDNENILKRHE